MAAFTWISKYTDGRASGFSYFNCYVNSANSQVLGWVAKEVGSSVYLLYYFLGPTGQGLATETRGTVKHAMEAVDGARAKVTVGLYQDRLPEITRQIVLATAIRLKRGW